MIGSVSTRTAVSHMLRAIYQSGQASEQSKIYPSFLQLCRQHVWGRILSSLLDDACSSISAYYPSQVAREEVTASPIRLFYPHSHQPSFIQTVRLHFFLFLFILGRKHNILINMRGTFFHITLSIGTKLWVSDKNDSLASFAFCLGIHKFRLDIILDLFYLLITFSLDVMSHTVRYQRFRGTWCMC